MLQKVLLFTCFAVILSICPSSHCRTQRFSYSQTYNLKHAKVEENNTYTTSYNFRAVIPGDFSNFNEDTLVGLVIGNLNVLQNLGEDSVDDKFNNIEEALSLGDLTKTRIRIDQGRGQIRAFVKKIIYRDEEEEEEESFNIGKIRLKWNHKGLTVSANYFERIPEGGSYLLPRFPADLDSLTPFDAPTFSQTMRPVIIYFGDKIYTAEATIIKGKCKFTKSGNLFNAKGNTGQIPLTEATPAKVNISLLELDPATGLTNLGAGKTMPMGDVILPQNQPFHIKATVNPGFEFNGWTADQNATFADSSELETTVTVTGPCNIKANVLAEATLTMAVAPANYGTTSPVVGSSVIMTELPFTIKATPNPGYEFLNWTITGTGEIVDPNSLETTATIYTAATITANFATDLKNLNLTMSPADGTGGTLNPGVGIYKVGQNVSTEITAKPADNYYFAGWTIDGTGKVAFAQSAHTTVTLQDDATVTANFVLKTSGTASLTLAVSPANSGSTNPGAAAYIINTGEPQAVSATAASGYKFSHWALTGSATVDNNMNANTAVTLFGNATLTAVFTK